MLSAVLRNLSIILTQKTGLKTAVSIVQVGSCQLVDKMDNAVSMMAEMERIHWLERSTAKKIMQLKTPVRGHCPYQAAARAKEVA